MKVVELWQAFIDSLGTQGGSLLLLTLILAMFYPLLLWNNSEGWKAAMFVLGAIVGIINNTIRATTPKSPPEQSVQQPEQKKRTGVLNLNE